MHFHAVSALGLSVLLVGMVLTPAAIEVEEVVRQAVPAREGLPEVSAGNLVGILLYFLWFNVGLISLLVPVRVNPQVIAFDWPFLVAITWMATFFFARGRTTRWRGAPFRGQILGRHQERSRGEGLVDSEVYPTDPGVFHSHERLQVTTVVSDCYVHGLQLGGVAARIIPIRSDLLRGIGLSFMAVVLAMGY